MKEKSKRIKPIDALNFLEEMRTLNSKIDGPKKMISIRVPENLLSLLKSKAGFEDRKYQNLIIEAIRQYLDPEK